VLYFFGVFASYLLVLHREKQSFPWKKVIGPALYWTALIAVVVVLFMVFMYHYHFVRHWPFLMK